jgi:hypothetical protein
MHRLFLVAKIKFINQSKKNIYLCKKIENVFCHIKIFI